MKRPSAIIVIGLAVLVGVALVPLAADANHHCTVNGVPSVAGGSIATIQPTPLNITKCTQVDARSDGTNNQPGFDPFRADPTTGAPRGLVGPDTINLFVTLAQGHGAVTNDPFGRIMNFDPTSPGLSTDLGIFFDPCVQGQQVPFLSSTLDVNGRLTCGPATTMPGTNQASTMSPFADAPEEHIVLNTLALGSYHEDFKDAVVWNAGGLTSMAIPRLLNGTTPIPGTPGSCLASETCVVEYVELGIPSTPADNLGVAQLELFKNTMLLRTKNRLDSAQMAVNNSGAPPSPQGGCDNSSTFYGGRDTCRPVVKWSLFEQDFDGNTFTFGATFTYCGDATNLGSFETSKPCLLFPATSYPRGQTQDAAVLGVTVDPQACLAPPGLDCSKP